MSSQSDITTQRESLDLICKVPEKIISVYSLEQHVWDNDHEEKAVRDRKPQLQTIAEFQIDPVRHFLIDLFKNMAAPYKPERRDNPIGQGYWIQAEFGSGKSHLLCFVAAAALGSPDAWNLIKEKEEKAGRGKRESLYQFWEDGLKAKSSGKNKGIFVIAKTLVGSGGGTVGYDKEGKRLVEYILDAAKEQIQKELGKNISLYPVELLADRFIKEDLDRYRTDLKKFLRNPDYWAEDEFIDIDDFIRDIQENRSPEYKRSCGDKLWRFYTDFLKVRPDIPAESEDILKHLVRTILAEGYSGVLFLLDEVSLFMKDRSEALRSDDEKTLVVLSNRLAKVENLPVWTVCSAQQAIESKMAGAKNIIADDRLKLVNLLKEANDYYSIVLSRVREIVKPEAIPAYYNFYKRGFSWPQNIGEDEFMRFFPFHKPAIEVLRDITFELTTARSAIHFMHQTLKHSIKNQSKELIRLWDFFDETMEYEEDPSGTHAGIVQIKTKRESDYRAYQICLRHVDEMQKGPLKANRDRSVKVLQILFLNFIAKRSVHSGISGDDLANAVLIEKNPNATVQENVEHYEYIAIALRKELPQIVEIPGEDSKPHFRFNPEITGINPRDVFERARTEAESHELMKKEAWQHLIALGEWRVKTRTMTLDLSNGNRSIFYHYAPLTFAGTDSNRDVKRDIEVSWLNKEVIGRVEMLDLMRSDRVIPPLETEQTNYDFGVIIGTSTIPDDKIPQIVRARKDRRIIVWTPGELTHEEKEGIISFAAYRKMVADYGGKETDDAQTIIQWVLAQLQSEIGKFEKIVTSSYGRGRMDAIDNTRMDFHVAGDLQGIIAPVIERVLSSTYESREISFTSLNFPFTNEDAVKVINGIVRSGEISKHTKLGKNENAVENFGNGLKIIKKGNWKELDISTNPFTDSISDFISTKLTDSHQTMKLETLYKNFMGIDGPESKNFGLTKRIIQIYVLCLVRKGSIRILMGQKSPLVSQFIDLSNMEGIDFTTKILDAMVEIQVVEKPENWEILRPYAEKILSEEIPASVEDSRIRAITKQLVDSFASEKESAIRTRDQAVSLFEILQVENPYKLEIEQVVALFSADIPDDNAIDQILYALQKSLGYQAFDHGVSDQQDVDDLAIKLKDYRDLQKLLHFRDELKTLHEYVCYPYPEIKELKNVRKLATDLNSKLSNISEYIGSEVKLRTELIGTAEGKSKTSTMHELIREYSSLYIAMHNRVADDLENHQKTIEKLISGDEMDLLTNLERIAAFQGGRSAEVTKKLTNLRDSIRVCSSPSHASVESAMRAGPEHDCAISFANYESRVSSAEETVQKAQDTLDMAITQALGFFQNDAVRGRLNQGIKEPFIKDLLGQKKGSALREFLIAANKDTPEFPEIINKYLKKVRIIPVKISEFIPKSQTIERKHIPGVAEEFAAYLEEKIGTEKSEKDELPMIQFE
jgi:hypothetical protein